MTGARRSAKLELLVNVVTGAAAACACALAVIYAFDRINARTDDPSEGRGRQVLNWNQYTSGGIRVGEPNAAVVIVEFADFKCPFCERAAADLRLLRRLYPKDVTVFFRHYPVHPESFGAAVASVCAHREGRFEQLHDILFASADSIGVVPLVRFATVVNGIDSSRFARCLEDESAIGLVAGDTLAARNLGIDATPTIIINGLRFEGNPGFEALRSKVVRTLEQRSDSSAG